MEKLTNFISTSSEAFSFHSFSWLRKLLLFFSKPQSLLVFFTLFWGWSFAKQRKYPMYHLKTPNLQMYPCTKPRRSDPPPGIQPPGSTWALHMLYVKTQAFQVTQTPFSHPFLLLLHSKFRLNLIGEGIRNCTLCICSWKIALMETAQLRHSGRENKNLFSLLLSGGWVQLPSHELQSGGVSTPQHSTGVDTHLRGHRGFGKSCQVAGSPTSCILPLFPCPQPLPKSEYLTCFVGLFLWAFSSIYTKAVALSPHFQPFHLPFLMKRGEIIQHTPSLPQAPISMLCINPAPPSTPLPEAGQKKESGYTKVALQQLFEQRVSTQY